MWAGVCRRTMQQGYVMVRMSGWAVGCVQRAILSTWFRVELLAREMGAWLGLRGDADIDAFYNSLLTGSGGDPPKVRLCRC